VIAGVDAEGRGDGVRRLAPVQPSKILCVGRNYKAHANELGNEVPPEPLLFEPSIDWSTFRGANIIHDY